MCSAEIAKPGSIMASGCRIDVVHEAKESGNPVSYWRLVGRLPLLLEEEVVDMVVTVKLSDENMYG